jgi:hypothetical protein
MHVAMSFPQTRVCTDVAKEALELKNLGSSSRDYHRFSSCFRDVLLANSEALAAARIADARESPTDLKLLDKILFQVGMRKRRHCAPEN